MRSKATVLSSIFLPPFIACLVEVDKIRYIYIESSSGKFEISQLQMERWCFTMLHISGLLHIQALSAFSLSAALALRSLASFCSAFSNVAPRCVFRYFVYNCEESTASSRPCACLSFFSWHWNSLNRTFLLTSAVKKWNKTKKPCKVFILTRKFFKVELRDTHTFVEIFTGKIIGVFLLTTML